MLKKDDLVGAGYPNNPSTFSARAGLVLYAYGLDKKENISYLPNVNCQESREVTECPIGKSCEVRLVIERYTPEVSRANSTSLQIEIVWDPLHCVFLTSKQLQTIHCARAS